MCVLALRNIINYTNKNDFRLVSGKFLHFSLKSNNFSQKLITIIVDDIFHVY